ncbi:MAG: hypothetical protein AAF755_09900 [Pseudomonadota bacterium]
MTQLKKLHAMQRVLQARFDEKQQHFQKLTAREVQLRQELSRLSEQGRRGANTDMALQSIGADMLWRGWVGRAKTKLNIELAQTLALKNYHLDEVKEAYGKLLAINQLVSKQQEKQRKTTAEVRLSNAIEQHLMRNRH